MNHSLLPRRSPARRGSNATSNRHKKTFAILSFTFALNLVVASVSTSAETDGLPAVRANLEYTESLFQDFQCTIEISEQLGGQTENQILQVASRGSWFRWDLGNRTLIITPDRAISVQPSKADENKYAVNRIRTDDFGIEQERQRMRLGTTLPFAPFSYKELRLTDLFELEEIELVDVTMDNLDGQDVQIVEALSRLIPETELRMRWFFRASDPKLLVKHEISNDQMPGSKRVMDITYGPMLSGIPFPETVKSAIYRDGQQTSLDFEAKLIDFKSEPPPKEYFSLAQFGIDDRLGLKRSKRWATVSLTIGIGLLVFGLLRFARRRRNRAT